MQEEVIAQVEGEGGPGKIDEPMLTALQEEVRLIAEAGENGLWSSRTDAENTRYCLWDGQSPDGRKHAVNNNDQPVMPFEGACDGRYRVADMVINEKVMLSLLATMRAQVVVKGVGSEDRELAGKISKVLRWIIRNQLGWKWIREMTLLANYVYGDSPAVGLMGVSWVREQALELRRLTAEDLVNLYLERVVESQEEMGETGPAVLEQAQMAAEEFTAALSDETYPAEWIAAAILGFFPTLKPARAKRVARELRAGKTAEFPVPYVKYDGISVDAKRICEDWFVPSNTRDFERARCYFCPEWLTMAEVLERAASETWAPEFVTALLGEESAGGKRTGGQEGVAAFKEYVRGLDGQLIAKTERDYRGLYQVIRAYFQAVNEDGIPGKYWTTMHTQIKMAAHERSLIDYAHGKWPGHVFQREALTKRLLDSRGYAELLGSHQDMIKLECDGYGDNSQLNGVPPILTRNRKTQGRLYLQPLAEIAVRTDGDVKWMQPPQFPATIDKMLLHLQRQVDEYAGRANAEVPAELVQLHREWTAFWWLGNLKEVYTQIVQLAQQYMPDEQLQRITDSDGMPIARSREDIQGQFDLEILFDPRDMDPEYLASLGKTIKNVLLAVDRDKTIDTSPVVETLLWRLAPDVADKALRSVKRATQDEIEDELHNFYLKILSGIEPAPVTDGSQNYQVRLDWYRQIQGENPAIWASLPPDRMAILQARLKHLAAMVEQYGANVAIGRAGARPGLPAAEQTETAAPAAMAEPNAMAMGRV